MNLNDLECSIGNIVYYHEKNIVYKAIIFERIGEHCGNDIKYKILITHTDNTVIDNVHFRIVSPDSLYNINSYKKILYPLYLSKL